MRGRFNRRSSRVQAQLSRTLPTLENPMMKGFRVQLESIDALADR
jgi:hypothetical protein